MLLFFALPWVLFLLFSSKWTSKNRAVFSTTISLPDSSSSSTSLAPSTSPPSRFDILQLQRGSEMQLEIVERSSSSLCLTVATIPRPFQKDPDAKTRQRTAISSWIDGGVSEVLFLVGGSDEIAKDFDLNLLELRPAVKSRVKFVDRLKIDRLYNNLPLVSSAFKEADLQASCPFVLFMNTDIIVLPKFAHILDAGGGQFVCVCVFFSPCFSIFNVFTVLQTMKNVSSFLFVGHRVRIAGLKPEETEQVVLGGHEAMWNRFVVGCDQPNPHAMDLFVWRKGQMQSTPLPDFLIGRNIWDLWIQSFAVRNWQVSLQMGNVLFVLHPDHPKPNQNIEEYQENARRASSSQPTDCNSLDCSEYFLYAGLCREKNSKPERHFKPQFCIRRKFNKGGNFIGKDEKIALSHFQYNRD